MGRACTTSLLISLEQTFATVSLSASCEVVPNQQQDLKRCISRRIYDPVTSSISSSPILRYSCKVHPSCVNMSYRRHMYPDDYDSHVVAGIAHRGYRPSGYHHHEMEDYRHGSRNPMYRTGRPHMSPPSCSYPLDCPPFRES